jgi:protein-disulfide isomerase
MVEYPYMEPTTQPSPRAQNNFLIPAAIIVAGALIAGAMIYINRSATVVQAPATQTVDVQINPITEGDHLLGNPNAGVVMLEYSDTECPFCQRFHPTAQKLVDNYGKDGKLAWAYRHFTVHTELAPKEAEATECAAELGGNAKFWEYLNLLFTKRKFPATESETYVNIDPKDLPAFAQDMGINRAAFATCLSSGKYTEKVRLQYNEAVAAGGLGTPYTVLFSQKPITREVKEYVDTINTQLLARMGRGASAPFAISSDNKKVLVSGAMDYALMNKLVEMMIRANS